MAKLKLNGTARWIIVALAIGALVFNSGVLYNDVKHLTESVKKLEQSHLSLNDKLDKLILTLAKGEPNEM